MNKTLLRTFCQTDSYCITLCLSFKSSVSHKRDLHISQIVGFFVLLVVNFSLSAKIFVSQSFMQISLSSGPFFDSLKHKILITVLWQKRTRRNCDEREKREGFMAIRTEGSC